jgi:hypothetical protein
MCTLLLFFSVGVCLMLPYPLVVVFTTCGTVWPWPRPRLSWS